MLMLIFFVALLWVTWKFFVLGLKLTWGIAKFVCTVFLLPLFILGLAFVGMFYLAIPLLIIGGFVALLGGLATA